MKLLVEICLHTTRQKEIPENTSDFQKERHVEYLSTMLPKPGRWPRKCGPIVWFRLRVAAVLPSSNGSISRGGCFRSLPKRRKSNPLPPFGVEQERASPA